MTVKQKKKPLSEWLKNPTANARGPGNFRPKGGNRNRYDIYNPKPNKKGKKVISKDTEDVQILEDTHTDPPANIPNGKIVLPNSITKKEKKNIGASAQNKGFPKILQNPNSKYTFHAGSTSQLKNAAAKSSENSFSALADTKLIDIENLEDGATELGPWSILGSTRNDASNFVDRIAGSKGGGGSLRNSDREIGQNNTDNTNRDRSTVGTCDGNSDNLLAM